MSFKSGIPEGKQADRRIRRRVLGDGEVAMEVVEVEDEKAAEAVKAVVEAAVMEEEVAVAVVVAEEVKTLHVTAVAKNVTSARSVRRRTASATNASRRAIYSRCAGEKNQKMVATPEGAPVVDLAETHGEETRRRLDRSTSSIAKP